MTFINFIKELLVRLQQDSPAFYKKLQFGAGLLLAILTTLVAGDQMFDWGFQSIILLKMPLSAILNILIGFISGIFAFSFTPVKDPSKL